ncbi:MAG TPA: hypothetical protein VHR72_07190 [Gemmataceae bacterium]|jgi:hypothetical protein|nr:hypothetical protein [Gemmataceae bacterium]
MSKRNIPKAGTYFSLPLDGQYVAGRILTATPLYSLVAIYERRWSEPRSAAEIHRSSKGRVLFRHVYTWPAFGRKGWKLLERVPLGRSYRFPTFRLGIAADGFFRAKTGKQKVRRISVEEGKRYSPIIMFSPDMIEERLRKEGFGPWPEFEQDYREEFGDRN